MIIAAICLLIVSLFFLIQFFFLQDENTSIEEIKKVIEARYQLEVIDQIEDSNFYYFSAHKERQRYELIVKRRDGEIYSLTNMGSGDKEQKDTELVTESEAIRFLEGLGNEVIEIEFSRDTGNYEALVRSGQLYYLIILDGRDGEVRSEEEVTEPVESGHDSYATITEQEAIEIALGHVPGEVDDVELEIIDAQVYYFIEIETENNQEAIVQVHAISGHATISWDD